MSYTATISLIITSLACPCIVGCATRPQVSYQRDVYPVLEAKCIGCHIPPHGEGYKKAGLDLAGYDTLNLRQPGVKESRELTDNRGSTGHGSPELLGAYLQSSNLPASYHS